MAKFMRKREVDTAGRSNAIIVKDAPSLLTLWRPVEGAIKAGKVVTDDAGYRIVRKLLRAIFSGNYGYVDREMLRSEHGIQHVGDFVSPAFWREGTGHSSSPQSSTMRRMRSFVVGFIVWYFRKKALSVASSTGTDALVSSK